MVTRSAFIVVVLLLAARVAVGQTFDLIEPPPGNAVRVYGLSADGTVAVGYSNTQNRAFTWTRAGGRQDLPTSLGQATGISGDGTTIIGRDPAYRYRGPGTFQNLGTIDNLPSSWAQGVSGDGNVIAGVAFAPLTGPGVAWRWTPSGGMQPLGYARPTDTFSEALGVSRDGSTIVGRSSGSGLGNAAFAWTVSSGMSTLPDAPGTQFGSSATAVNHDGRIIAGFANLGPVIWRDRVPTLLPQPAGWGSMVPHGISDDGTVVAGEAQNPSFQTEAFVWTQSRGSESLLAYLTSQGVSVPGGWNLVQTFALSADGRTFGGYALNSAGTIGAGFVATVPTPPVLSLLTSLAAFAARRRR